MSNEEIKELRICGGPNQLELIAALFYKRQSLEDRLRLKFEVMGRASSHVPLQTCSATIDSITRDFNLVRDEWRITGALLPHKGMGIEWDHPIKFSAVVAFDTATIVSGGIELQEPILNKLL